MRAGEVWWRRLGHRAAGRRLGLRVSRPKISLGRRFVACEGFELLRQLAAARQSQPAPFQIEVIARELGITLELGLLPALFGALQAVADLLA
jgi:hypothetical protein